MAKKKGNSYLPSVAQSCYERFVFRSFQLVCTCNCETWNEFTNPRENGLNKMAEGREHKFRCFSTIPIRVCAAQRGRDLGTPDLERVIHFRDVSQDGVYIISNARKLIKLSAAIYRTGYYKLTYF